MTPELISHPLCPFKQRLVLSLIRVGKTRGQDFKTTYVNLANLPDWFLALSPAKTMPALKAEDERVNFDVNDILRKFTTQFEHRALTTDETQAEAAADDLLIALRNVFTAESVADVDAAAAVLMEKVRDIPADAAALERVKTNRGDLREVVYAPVFSLLFANPGLARHPLWAEVPRLAEYGQLLAGHPDTLASKCPEYAEEFARFFALFHSAYPAWEEQRLTS